MNFLLNAIFNYTSNNYITKICRTILVTVTCFLEYITSFPHYFIICAFEDWNHVSKVLSEYSICGRIYKSKKGDYCVLCSYGKC